MQDTFTPGQLVMIEKNLKKDEKNGLIKNLTFGQEIIVSDETGYWEEVE